MAHLVNRVGKEKKRDTWGLREGSRGGEGLKDVSLLAGKRKNWLGEEVYTPIHFLLRRFHQSVEGYAYTKTVPHTIKGK